MKSDYVIIVLLLIIMWVGSVQSCNHKAELIHSQDEYHALQNKVDSLEQVASVLTVRIDSLQSRKTVINKYYAPKIDTIRSASSHQLDSIIRTIIARHDLLHN